MYSLYNKRVAELQTEIRPKNTSMVGSIYYNYLDYKGLLIYGGCDTWTDFRTKAVNLPFDNLYLTYVKAYFAIQSFNKDSLGYSQSHADCADEDMLIDLFASLEDTNVNRQFTGRCIGTDGVFHDWRVYTCDGHTIFCVDCKIACSDEACPGVADSIVRSCREESDCHHSLGAMAAFRFDIAQLPVYPKLLDITVVADTNTITVSALVNETSSIYCAAIAYNSDGTFPGIDNIYRVKRPVMAGAGIGYTQVTGIVRGSNTPVTVTITDLSPSTTYGVLCYTEDPFQHGMDLSAIRSTQIDVTTDCCATAAVAGKSFLTAGSTGPSNTASDFLVQLDAVPSQDTIYEIVIAAGSVSDGCDSSKVSMSDTSLPSLYPTTFYFKGGDAASLSQPFVVDDDGEGCFVLSLSEIAGSGTFSTSSFVLHILKEGAASPTAPGLLSASFSSSGIFILAEFTEATDRAGSILVSSQESDVYSPFSCSTIVSFTGSGSATCQWTSTTTLKAKLHITPSSNSGYATVGSTFTILADTIKAACPNGVESSVCDSYSTNSALSVGISSGDTPIVPMVSISTATTVGACDDIIIDCSGSSGSGGRDWVSMSWSVQAKDTTNTELTANLTEFGAYLNKFHVTTTRNRITLPKSLEDYDDLHLPDGNRTMPVDQEINIVLTLTNFLGQSNTGSTTVVVTSDDLIPNVRINGPVQLTRYTDQSLNLFASSYIPNCNSSGSGSIVEGGLSASGIVVNYAWGTFQDYEFLDTLPSLALNPKNFKLDPYSLTADIDTVSW